MAIREKDWELIVNFLFVIMFSMQNLVILWSGFYNNLLCYQKRPALKRKNWKDKHFFDRIN